ncbi:phosphatidylserine decarboxylase [Exilibacterium tricleocarpae]|uniref:Phosphatidylserine decarboxylase proenzyme n=1 Tax=Exilibacterium tricleocarpae TaxID=2591008 RepID=A0A545T639_9GAMM|nr:archaetidylserine decarboxylase [Exilibacterium tricleocarpae]TQV72645.1 phosphatidylserine decarboxylase [Exilibacterium tricleocarpae]
MNEKLFAALQYLLPQHALSRAAGWLAETETAWLKDSFIRWFAERYEVDMSEAEQEDPSHYKNFNAFFTRALKPGARTVATEKGSVVCPADGAISQIGDIEHGRIFQAKGQDFSAIELLGGDTALAEPFMGGKFATIYLSPKDYHRVHMPAAGTLKTMVHIPGDLFSVNEATANQVPRLFARNERVAALFDTEHGPMAVVLVGAMIVASIETTWAGVVAPTRRQIRTSHYPDLREFSFAKGDEMGRFKLGSTAIVLFGPGKIAWDDDYRTGAATRMGEKLGGEV